MNITDMFKYDFMITALLVGSVVGICGAIVGQFLVLKKFAMIGDGLAHVSFAAVGIAILMETDPLLTALPVVLVASVFILRIKKVEGDAAIGLISAFSVALGIMFASLSRGFNVDLMSYLFGSILSISKADVTVALSLSLLILLVVWFMYEKLFSATFDQDFTTAVGVKTQYTDLALALVASLTVVVGIRVVGTMLISSMIIFPASSAVQWRLGFKATLALAVLISVVAVFAGLVLSFVYTLPSGAAIVMVHAIIFLISLIIRWGRKI